MKSAMKSTMKVKKSAMKEIGQSEVGPGSNTITGPFFTRGVPRVTLGDSPGDFLGPGPKMEAGSKSEAAYYLRCPKFQQP